MSWKYILNGNYQRVSSPKLRILITERYIKYCGNERVHCGNEMARHKNANCNFSYYDIAI